MALTLPHLPFPGRKPVKAEETQPKTYTRHERRAERRAAESCECSACRLERWG